MCVRERERESLSEGLFPLHSLRILRRGRRTALLPSRGPRTTTTRTRPRPTARACARALNSLFSFFFSLFFVCSQKKKDESKTKEEEKEEKEKERGGRGTRRRGRTCVQRHRPRFVCSLFTRISANSSGRFGRSRVQTTRTVRKKFSTLSIVLEPETSLKPLCQKPTELSTVFGHWAGLAQEHRDVPRPRAADAAVAQTEEKAISLFLV